jgi:hypothetical protein
LDDSTDLRPAAGEQMSLQMQSEAASPVAMAPVQVSWTGLAPPVEAAPAAIEPEAVTPAPQAEAISAPEAEVNEPKTTEPALAAPTATTESTQTVESAQTVEPTTVAAEKKVVWSSSPSNSTISFGPGYSSRRDDP